jgi:chaperonin GroES
LIFLQKFFIIRKNIIIGGKMAKKMELKPLLDRVIVEPMLSEAKTKYGVVLPDSVEKEKPQQGKVIAVGSGRLYEGKLTRPEVKVGDLVLYKKYGGDEIEINNKKIMILEAEDVLAILK